MRLIIHIAEARLALAQWMKAGAASFDEMIFTNCVGRFRIGLRAVERHVVVPQPGRFGGRAMLLDVGARLLRLAQVDHRDEPHLLDLGHRVRVIAPAHATVVSRREKFLMPSRVSFVTC